MNCQLGKKALLFYVLMGCASLGKSAPQFLSSDSFSAENTTASTENQVRLGAGAVGDQQARQLVQASISKVEEMPLRNPAELSLENPQSIFKSEQPPLQLTFRQAINLALMQSPDAVTARAGKPVVDATRTAASVYPWNPSVQVGVDPYTRDRAGNFLATKNQVTVTQTLELAHQPVFRRRAADASWNQQNAAIAQLELTAVVSGMRAYIDALYRKGLYDTADKTAQLQASSVEILDRRVKAGISTPNELLTARVAARQSERQASIAKIDYLTSLSTLRTALGITTSDQVELVDGLSSYNFRPIANVVSGSDSDVIGSADLTTDRLANSIDNRPDIISSRFAVAAAQANLDLSRANTTPNLATGPTYERDESGTLFFGVTAQIDLPVWNTGCPLVNQRAAEVQQQLITLKQVRTRAELQAAAAIQRYARAYKVWQNLLAADNSAANDLKTMQDAFKQGQATILEVLSIQDNLNQEQKGRLDIFNELSLAAADVVSALAVDPNLIIEFSIAASTSPAQQASPLAPTR